uniref:Mitochondrial carrier protein n=1 Tax=Alexandrium catenella TaxID=2925 RepID=A0A7S1RCI6_ALECA
MVQMPLFEYLKHLHPWNGDASISRQGVVGMTCGGVAGAVAGAVTTPLDVAKTQIMLSSHRWEPSVSSALARVYAQGGFRSLFSGVLPRTAYVGSSCMLSFGAFEWTRSLLWARSRA